MAASSVMQSSVATQAPRLFNRASPNQNVSPILCMPRSHRSAGLRVKCTIEDGQKEQVPTPITTPTPPPQPTPTPPRPSPPKVSTKFGDVLAFSGPAPERINGRLAMIGFVAAMAVELSNGEDIFTQISNGGVPLFVGTSIILSLASLIPLFKGVTVQSKSNGIMSSDAELWNGRFAMLGLVALAFTEYVKGGALV